MGSGTFSAMRRAWRGRVRRAARTARGAIAVEAALTLPLVMTVFFGVVEISLLVKDNIAINSAVRSGGRIGSATLSQGGGTCAIDCRYTIPAFAQAAVSAMTRESGGLTKTSATEIWVFKANATGFPGNSTAFTTCTTDCVQYRWNTSTNAFDKVGGSWDYRTVAACVNAADQLGIYMTTNHQFISGLFSRGVNLSDRVVFNFEPLPNGTCASGART